MSELELVVRRFVHQTKGPQSFTPPIKLTRSVGLQINMSTQSSAAPPPTVVTVTAVPTAHVAQHTPHKTTTTSPIKPNVTMTAAATSKPGLTSPMGSQKFPHPRLHISPATDNIASYVPQQAMPRYRMGPQPPRKSDEGLPTSPPSNLVSYVNNGHPTSLLRNTSVHITPVVSNGQPPNRLSVGAQQPLGQANKTAMAAQALARARAATADSAAASSLQNQQAIARWAKVPASRTPATTVVNKVTLPGGRLPNVIDLTEENLEKERAAAAAAGRISRPMQQNKSPTAGPAMPPARGVAVKSTTLNGQRNQMPNGRPPVQQAVKAVALTHPAPLPPAPVGPSNPSWKPLPFRPTLDIKRVSNGNFPHSLVSRFPLSHLLNRIFI